MTRILFVDDEPNVLAGLRRMLRTYRREWEMEFCESGAAALERLEAEAFDVVVSDMRMPGMDGAELLGRVRDLRPDTVRIVLSGHSDREMTLRTIGPAHQYLSKPCEPENLRRTIQAAVNLHQEVHPPEVRALVESVESLPTLPAVYVELVEEINSPNASVDRAGQIIARDLGMSAKILQLVNSSFFGLPVRVADAPHAVALLGLGILKPMVLSSGVFRQFDGVDLGGLSLGRLTTHCLHVGVVARDIAKANACDPDTAEDAFLGGMMHDVGRLVLAQHDPGEYARVNARIAETGENPCLLEREAFGASHGQVGGYLLRLWGLPSALVEAVALHHKPSKTVDDRFTALTAVHSAEVLTRGESVWDVKYLARLGLDEHFADGVAIPEEQATLA